MAAKKIDYAALYTLRADGRYMGYWRDASGKRHAAYDRDPARLYDKLAAKEEQSDAPLTLGEVAERWSDSRFPELAFKTVEAYKPVFRRVVARFGDGVLDSVESPDVTAWLKNLASQGYARRTVQMHRDMLSQIYNFAIEKHMTRYNPVDHSSMPHGLPEVERQFADEEAIHAVKTGLKKPFGMFAFFCLYSGLRRGEALAIKYEDVDFQAKQIHVRRAVFFEGNKPNIKEPKTKKGCRNVILLDVLADALPKKSRGYIFGQASGELMTRDQYRKAWQHYCEDIGCAITSRQLRRGYATLLYEAGIEDKDAQELLGHTRIELTRNYYTTISSRQKSRTAARLNGYVAAEDAPEDDVDITARAILALLEGKDARAVLARLAAMMADSG